jgi:hypothetical protein
MKLEQLVNSKVALSNLVKGSLPIGIAWKLKKFILVINPELESFDEIRNQKIIEMGYQVMKDEVPTGTYQVKNENLELFTSAIKELLEKEVEVTIPEIKIDELLSYKDANGKGIEITAGDLMLLDWLIKD